jgi:ATP-binding cassette subfamily C protein LapB
VLGLYQPTEGAVLVDGVDVRQIDPSDLRRAIGHVPQDPMLFYGSLKHNLLIGAPFASEDDMLRRPLGRCERVCRPAPRWL